MTIRIQLNGEERELATACTVADLIEELGLRPEQVAVELNKDLVTRAVRSETPLSEGDQVELVTLVGGG
jgi:thiamine biosynthesis protein ThiS